MTPRKFQRAARVRFRLLIGTVWILAAGLGCKPSAEESSGSSSSGADGLTVRASSGGSATDVSGTDGAMSYSVATDQAVPEKAQAWHRQARLKGQEGDFPAAIELLKQAIGEAPRWAYPRYDLAFTYLLQGNRDQALAAYLEVDELEPEGFFTAKTAIWTLQRESKGELPAGTYLSFVSLEYADAADRVDLIEQMVRRLPRFAPALKEKALIVRDDGLKLQLFDQVLALQPDAETEGIVLLNKAGLEARRGRVDEARQITEGLLQNSRATKSNKLLAQQLLKTFQPSPAN